MTSMTTSTRPRTVRDALVEALRATAAHNPADVAAPIAVLWPDAEGAWAQVAPTPGSDALRVLTLGDYAPEQGRGPVPWLRIQAALHADPNDAELVVVYLPGVARKELVDPERLPEALRPLAGVVVRSTVFAQRNGSDWTPSAFLTNDALGLGLSVSASKEAREALGRSLPRLLDVRVGDLIGRTLDSTDFDKLLVQDPARQLLMWLGDPAAHQSAWEADGTWAGFVSLAKKEYKVDLVRDGQLAVAQRLGNREGRWAEVWSRFADAPRAFPGVVEALRLGRPNDVLMVAHPGSWPQDNEEAEATALAAIAALADKPVEQVRTTLVELHSAHAPRLETVWARLDQTAAAQLVDRLSELADLTGSIGAGTDVTQRAEHHARAGWRVDRAFIAALATLEQGHPQAGAAASVAERLYRPWLEASVNAFQAAWTTAPPAGRDPGIGADEPAGTCALFVDGLRYDLAAELALGLESRGFTAKLDWGLAGVPTVTGTCKPAVTPVAGHLEGGAELTPSTAAGSVATQEVLKKLMAEGGWDFLAEDSVGDPGGRGWTEGGDVDTLGHSLGVKLAHRIPGEVRALSTRIAELLNSGWQRVVVVTDHGWLLLPGKLPKHHVPAHLMAPRKGRCARLAPNAAPPAGVRLLPWRWDEDIQIALAPGIHAFEDGKVYEHGGLSPQESVVPRLVVSRPQAGSAAAALAVDLSWVNLKLKVEVLHAPDGCTIDLRTKANDPSTSLVTAVKELREHRAALFAEDEHAGEAAILVVIGPEGNLLANKPTQIPED